MSMCFSKHKIISVVNRHCFPRFSAEIFNSKFYKAWRIREVQCPEILSVPKFGKTTFLKDKSEGTTYFRGERIRFLLKSVVWNSAFLWCLQTINKTGSSVGRIASMLSCLAFVCVYIYLHIDMCSDKHTILSSLKGFYIVTLLFIADDTSYL